MANANSQIGWRTSDADVIVHEFAVQDIRMMREVARQIPIVYPHAEVLGEPAISYRAAAEDAYGARAELAADEIRITHEPIAVLRKSAIEASDRGSWHRI